jgi:TonB family protein
MFLLAFFFLALISCKEDNKKNPLDLDNVWYSGNMIDKEPQVKEGNTDSLLNVITSYMSKTKTNQVHVAYNLLIDKQGDLQQITLDGNNNPSIDSIVIATVKDWKFTPGVKAGKNVNSIYPIKLKLGVTGSFKPINESDFYIAVEEMPEIIGGLKSIQEKIHYPEIAKRAGIEGKVYVLAFIDETGNVVNARIIKGIGAGCDEAALDAVKQTKFTPGRQRGKPVKVQVSIPIVFKLQ